MVRGTGIDIVEIARIKKLIDSHGMHFLTKVFTAGEIDFCMTKAHPEIHFAGRWAVKEAFYKALPGELQPHATWKCIEVLPQKGSGRPTIVVTESSFRDRCDRVGVAVFHLSISHERSYCTAFVLLE